MTHWSSARFDQYVKHEPWNVKPRWQELAGISSSFSLPTPQPSPYADRMAPTSDHADGGSRHRTRSALQLHGDNATELGASRPRSRSRPRRPLTRMSSTRSRNRQHNKSGLGRAYPYAISKQTMFLSLMALVNTFLSWFGFGVLSYSGPLVRSIAKQVWTPSDSDMAEVRHNLCRIPLVPRVLHCGESISPQKVLREQPIQDAIPGIVFALSENPDAVDEMFDLLEDVINELDAMKHELGMIEYAERNLPNSLRFTRRQVNSVGIKFVHMIATRLMSDLMAYDASKDRFLVDMHHRLQALDPHLVYDTDQMSESEHIGGSTSSQPLLRVVFYDFMHLRAVLDTMRTTANTVEIAWHDLLHQTNTSLNPFGNRTAADDKENPFEELYEAISTTAVQRPSLLKRFMLWSFPVLVPPKLDMGIEQITRPTKAESKLRMELLLAKIQRMQPLIEAIRASTYKAHAAANTADSLVRSEELSLLRWVFGRKAAFDEDMKDGLRHLRGLVPMLMEQRRGQRADRAYQRSKARLELGSGV